MSRLRSPLLFASALALTWALTACSASGAPAPSTDAEVPAGARELAAPALQLVTVAVDGAVVRTPLPIDDDVSGDDAGAGGAAEEIARIEPAETITTDGRYVFAAREGSVTIVDGGAWSWHHGDHFHYYDGPARVVGDVVGSGMPTVVTGERSIGIRFDGGEIVLVRATALGDGEIEELLRADVEPGEGTAVPLAYGAWVTEQGDDGAVAGLREVREDGAVGDLTPCANAAGTITTVVGVVVGCDDGALIAVDGRPAKVEHVERSGDIGAVTAFSGRSGRPTVSALAGPRTVWLLDSRERSWVSWTTDTDLTSIVAVDDSAGHVVAISVAGEVIVLSADDGDVLSRTDAGYATGAALAATQRTTFLIGDSRAIAFDHATGEAVSELTVPSGGTTVLTGN